MHAESSILQRSTLALLTTLLAVDPGCPRRLNIRPKVVKLLLGSSFFEHSMMDDPLWTPSKPLQLQAVADSAQEALADLQLSPDAGQVRGHLWRRSLNSRCTAVFSLMCLGYVYLWLSPPLWRCKCLLKSHSTELQLSPDAGQL